MNKSILILWVSLSLILVCTVASLISVDGYFITEAFGLSRYGPAKHFKDNGDGTFTDEVTKFMWEIKTDDDSIHDVDNAYTWSEDKDGNTDPDGTLFEDFLNALNNTCAGEGLTTCKSNKDCSKGTKCGFAGYRDWCVPDVKQLQSIVDYGSFRPASSVYGETATTYYWTATPNVFNTNNAWTVNFFDGLVLNSNKKTDSFHARAMRPCR